MNLRLDFIKIFIEAEFASNEVKCLAPLQIVKLWINSDFCNQPLTQSKIWLILILNWVRWKEIGK